MSEDPESYGRQDPKAYNTRELLRMLGGRGLDRVPPGWHTAAQIRDASGFSIGYTNKLVRSMLNRGLITEVRSFKIPYPNRGPYPTPHYKLTPEAAATLRLTPPI